MRRARDRVSFLLFPLIYYRYALLKKKDGFALLHKSFVSNYFLLSAMRIGLVSVVLLESIDRCTSVEQNAACVDVHELSR